MRLESVSQILQTEMSALLKPEPLLVTCDAKTLVGLFLL